MSRHPLMGRKRFSRSSTAAAVQRSAIFPLRQRFTLRWTSRVPSLSDPIGLVDLQVLSSAGERPRREIVSVSPRPSRMLAAAPGWASSSELARLPCGGRGRSLTPAGTYISLQPMRALPNAIATARALAVVPVVLLLDDPAAATAALVVFALAAVTDAVDGPLARRLGAVTRLGAFLDPLADKVLVLGTLLALLGHDAVDAWVVAVIFGREVVATGLRGVAAGRGVSIEASAYGKAKTVFQAVAVAGLLLALAVPTAEIAAAAGVALAGAVALTVASGVDLVLRAPALLAVPARASDPLRADAR